jgi:C1A family cysteine protease
MGAEQRKLAMGWLRDYPDARDYTTARGDIKGMLSKVGLSKVPKAGPQGPIDLRKWCSPIEDQNPLQSCTAHAGVGMLEYFERRAFGNHIDASRLFLYKVTRNLLKWTGDTGAFPRTTMGAMVLFGVPPEDYWDYDPDKLDDEPPAFCYAFAQNFQAIQYVRLDPPGITGPKLLDSIKWFLNAGFPSMFGFTVFSSIWEEEVKRSGNIPMPGQNETVEGGHAVVVVGYDDARKIENPTGPIETVGALLIRNSWGSAWGERGYGWLPYDYVLAGLAVDWWTLLKNEWVDTGKFGF